MSADRAGPAAAPPAGAEARALAIDVELPLATFRLRCVARLPMDGVTAVFGPSGAGKSALLRCIAGFEPARGRVALGDDVWLDTAAGVNVPAHRRPVGYMFQDARLFSHLSVGGNLRFAARRAGDGPPSLDDVVAAFDLGGLLRRRPGALSGGERQRVALARTLLTKPALLLLDEPLAALDSSRKADILPYLEALPAQFGMPTLYVSHAIDEVVRLAGRALVLAEGRARAFGPTASVLQRLDVQTIAGPVEASVVVRAQVVRHDAHYRLTWLSLGGQRIATPLNGGVAPGAMANLRVRARDVALATARPTALSIRNVLAGRLTELAAVAGSPFAEAAVDVAGQCLRARITRAAADDLGLAEGMDVYALVKSVSFDA